MPVTEFDNLLRDQYEQGSFEFKPASWDRLSNQLPVKKKKTVLSKLFWLPMLAAAAIAGFVIVPRIMDTEGTRRPEQTSASHTGNHATIASPSGVTKPGTVVAPSTIVAIIPLANQHPTITSNQPAKPIAKKLLTPAPPVASNSGQLVITNNVAAVVPTVRENQVVVSQSQAQQADNVQSAPQQTAVTQPRAPIAIRNANFMDVPQYGDAPKGKFNASSLSIAGGYKYGTANAGYMLGVNGRKNLSGKIFLEGDLAFSNSRNAQTTNETTNETFALVKAVASTNTVGARALSRGEVISNMYYLQLTPTVGYQLLKSMSVGAGADVQRLFRDGESTLYVMDGSDVKAMPQMDYGLVGKAEYSLTRIFKAGIQYRQGMNSTVAPDKNYLNRSYIQVQLKLGILGK